MIPWAFIGQIILITLLCATSSKFVAADNSELSANYCLPFDRFAPDGKVYKIGNRYIRTCHPVLGESEARRGLLKFNPERIAGLNLDRLYLSIILTDRVSYQQSLERRTKSLPLKSIRKFGQASYKAHETELRGENGKPGRGLYEFDESLSKDQLHLESHFISCNDEASFNPPGFSCNVHINYKGIRAQHLFLINLEGGKTTEAIMDRFPEVPEDLMTILEFADYTDRMDELPDGIEIIE